MGSSKVKANLLKSIPEENIFNGDAVDDKNIFRISSKPGFGQRHVFIFMSFFGIAVAYALRVVLFVTIVPMIQQKSQPNDTLTTFDSQILATAANYFYTAQSSSTRQFTSTECEAEQTAKANNTERQGEFDWTEAQIGLAIGSFFWGYMLTGIPGGQLSERFGAKHFFGLGVGGTALFTLLTPLATRRFDLTGLLVCRAIEGLLEGATLPAMHVLMHTWAPPEDRSWMVSAAFSGALFGTMITYPTAAFLCEQGFDNGWASAFYIFGAIGLVWTMAWCLLVYESPLTHPFISDAEKSYLERACRLSSESEKHKRPRFPMRAVLTSLPFSATIVAHFTFTWGYYSMLSLLPKYMSDVLHFEIKQNGLILMLPYLAHMIVLFAASPIVDRLRKSGRISTTNVRKLCCALGFVLPGAAFAILYLLGCNNALVVVLLVFAVAAQAFGMPGFYVNHLDLAPPFAGTLLGITNSVATIPGILSPYITGIIISANKSSRFLWGFVFWIASGVYALGFVYFSLFGSGELQSWGQVSSAGECEDAVQSVRIVAQYNNKSDCADAELKARFENTNGEKDTSLDGSAISKRVYLNRAE